MEPTDKKIVSVDSIFADTYVSSCDFVYNLPEPVLNIKYVKLLGGTYPQTTERTLFLDLVDFNKKPVSGPYNGKYNHVLRFDGTAGRTIFQDLLNEGWMFKEDKIRLNQMRIRVYDSDSQVHSFGTDAVGIAQITGGSPTSIQTSANHGLVNGDIVRIFDVDNMSTISLNKGMNSRFVVTVTGANTFTVVFDTTGEAANQPKTGQSTTAYKLGLNSEIMLETDYSYIDPNTYTAHADGTQISTFVAHNLVVGQTIRISGFDNGATASDNNKINGQHQVIRVINPTNFTIGAALSAYPVNSPKTGVITYALGSHGSVRIDKMQCSFDFMFITQEEFKSSKLNKYKKNYS
jgi:hypothetical protein